MAGKVFSEWLRAHSEGIRCPRCGRSISLDNVCMTSSFQCVHCEAEICVSLRYRRVVRILCVILGLLIPYFDGVRGGTLLFVGAVCTVVVGVFLLNGSKYIVPPRLNSSDSAYSGSLHLGP